MFFLDKLFSCILGLIIGSFFTYCFTKKIIYSGPDSNVFKHKVFNLNGRCYKFSAFPVICGINDSTFL
ncbi:hypothetical protein CPAV1605_438 [seawater metagenome]|uniref:Uncharacterized protein n=1 Tax=seawater metagenome TaxID=1561972 RepID=A0A5E8CH38_9ZZZZ